MSANMKYTTDYTSSIIDKQKKEMKEELWSYFSKLLKWKPLNRGGNSKMIQFSIRPHVTIKYESNRIEHADLIQEKLILEIPLA